MNRALIIVAHGSSVKPETALTVTRLAESLADVPELRARFDEVRVCFLKQSPLLEDEAWHADETVVIPFFMADGYFVQKVLPRFIPESAHVTAPVGTTDLSDVVLDAVAQLSPSAHLVLVGHGTERNPASGASVEELAAKLRAEPQLASVTTAFVDQDPRLETTWDRVPQDGASVVVVPYFAFAGPHTKDDIPRGLGLPDASEGPHQLAGHAVFYAPAVGCSPLIVDVLCRLAGVEPTRS